MAKASRRYSEKTLKVLYGSSGNQCAHPDCTNPVIAEATPLSDAAVLAQICHIYAASDNGPRGKPGLTEEERNAPENLILMCGHHHPLVDKHWKDYPADLLKFWKKTHEAKFQQGTAEAAKLQATMRQHAFLQAFSDEQISRELEKIRKCRFLVGYAVKDAATALAARVEAAELAGGSSDVKAEALAWCARFLSLSDAGRARELLQKSKALGASSQAMIADAFIVSNTDKNAALALLAPLNTPAARSAAMRIVTNHEQAKGAIAWLGQTELTINDFDADGKFLYLMNALAAADWPLAQTAAEAIAEQDLQETPALCHAVALAVLVQAVPDELRETLLLHAPFEADRFPLAADEAALAARRKAQSLFARVSAFGESMGLIASSNPASDFSLWLKLRDPRGREQGLEELRESMRDPQRSIRRINLAVQFGIKFDVPALENEINRRVALSGKGSADEAVARYALAFVQGGPRAAAEYIAKYRDQLYEHLQKDAIQTIEIELLARGGLVQAAKDMLKAAAAEGTGDKEQRHLGRIIAEAEGADPAAERKKLYEETNETKDLVNLVSFLEDKDAWREMVPHIKELFARTRSLEDALRLAKALHESDRTSELFDFLSSHQDLIEQSPNLKTLWAWSLYREGRFADATAVLSALAAKKDDRNYRALRVNIAVASGNWTDLVDFTNSEWEKREERTPVELLGAGQLAQAVNGPHARNLITEAARRAPDDPNILAGCYFHATQAGWEQNPVTGGWLTRAAELSGDDGPLKSVSLKELLDRKPDWDRQESTVLQQLNEGKMPSFGAAQALNRSLIDFVLLPSLANLNEADTRRRAVIYAFSGARPAAPLPPFVSIALDVTAIMTLARLGLLQKVIDAYDKVVIPHATLAWLMWERRRATFHQPSRIKDAHFLRKLLADKALNVLSAQLPRDNALAREVGDDLAALLVAAKSKSGKEGSAIVVRSAPVHLLGSLANEEADLSAHSGYLCSCGVVIEKLRAKGLLTLQEEERARSYLKLHERSWPKEPVIADNTELYLDDLSVSYLTTVGVIDKLGRAGLTAYITEHENREANQLIAHEALSERQLEIIDTIQRTLAAGLKSGRVRVMRSTVVEDDDDDDESVLKAHPTFSLLEISENVDALVVDDRFVNSHLILEGRNHRTPVLTSLDLLDDLTAKGVIKAAELFAHRTHLRQAGLQLIPITQDELMHHLGNTRIENDAIVETAELRAIREAWLRARMIKMVQIPAEAVWLHRSTGAVIQTIQQLWREKADEREAAVLSEWLARFIDMRGWTPSALPGNERGFAMYVHVAQLSALASPLTDASPERQEAYTNWVEGGFLKEIKERQPESFRWMADRAREMIAHWTQKMIEELKP